MLRRFLLLAVILATLLLLVPVCQAPAGKDPYYISGIVSDELGDPVEGATVIVERLETGETNIEYEDGTLKPMSPNSSADSPRVVIITDSDGYYNYELLNMDNFDDGESFGVTATKGSKTGAITVEIDLDSGAGYDDGDITISEGVVETALVPCSDLWILVGLFIFLIVILVFSRRR